MTAPRLHVVREGEGPFVVLSHALGSDLRMWDGVAALLARAHTVLRYDHRNHGGSERVAEPFGMQALAAERPDLLRSVTIANSSAHYPDPAPWRARAEAVAARGVEAIADGAVERWLTPAFAATPEGATAARALRDVLVRNDPRAYIDSCAAVAAIDLREGNRRIAVPTLVIAGAQDLATPPAMSEAIVAAIPGARLATLDAAHVSAVERPAEFVALLIDFWRSL